MAKLTIIRGTPGSGKTTLAKEKFNCLHIEADMFFERDGKYRWNKDDRGKNHKWCQDTCDHALAIGMDVVVTNTFTTRKEIKPYRDMAEKHGAQFAVITCKGRHKNTHDVPEDVLSNMDSRWEDWDGERIAKSDCLKSESIDDILLPRDIGLVSRMVDSKFVKVKNLTDGIQSFNYNRRAFYDGAWNEVTTHARGLFIRGTNVVARSFDKFFRIGEVPETSIENIFKSIGPADRVYVSRKYNGYLGIVSFDRESDCWRFFSKSSTDNAYSNRFREIFQHDDFQEMFLDRYEKSKNYSFVFEVVDNKNDPHFVLADDIDLHGKIYLIGVFENKLFGDGLTPDGIEELLGKDSCFWCPNTQIVDRDWLADEDSFRDLMKAIVNEKFCNYNTDNPSTIPGSEGSVVSIVRPDESIFRFKVKTANYCYWKHVRRFVENPEWNETGKLVISDYNGRPNELIEQNELMTEMTEKIRNLSSDELGKFFITDLSGHERIDMIKMSHALTEE